MRSKKFRDVVAGDRVVWSHSDDGFATVTRGWSEDYPRVEIFFRNQEWGRPQRHTVVLSWYPDDNINLEET